MTGLPSIQRTPFAPETGGPIARAIVRYPIVIVIAWIAAFAIFAPLADRLEDALATTVTIDGEDSAAVAELLEERFGSPFANSALLAVSGLPDLHTPAGASLLEKISDAVTAVSGVAATSSYHNTGDPFFIGDDGTGAIVVAGLDVSANSIDALVSRLRQATAALTTELQFEIPEIRLLWTGEDALNHDLRVVARNDAQSAELRALPLTLTVLIVVFGSIAGALLPLFAGTIAIPFALGAAMLFTGLWPQSALLVNVVTMIGLALSIDYSLLMTDRFRQARADGRDLQGAAVECAHHAGRTVLISGLAVAIGFAALLVVPLDELRSIALGGLLATIIAVLLATMLLPSLLSWLGWAMEFGRLWPTRSDPRPHDGWARWGRFVVKHPIAVLVIASLPVVGLAAQTTRLQLELPHVDWLPTTAEATTAIHELRDMGRGGVVDTIRLILTTPPETTIVQAEGWSALERLTEYLADNPQIEQLTSLVSMKGGGPYDPRVADFLNQANDGVFVSADRRATLIEVIPSHQLESFEVARLVRSLKSADPVALTGLAGTEILVGGTPAFQVEYDDAVMESLMGVVGLVLGGTIAGLMVWFRSFLIPIKAVALNLLSVAAGFGAVTLMFQDGYGASLLGLSAPTGAVFPVVLPLTFCAVFGLSMDYEVFLVARVAELRSAGLNEKDSIVEGLARTGRIITGAAAVMVCVFAAFAFGNFLLIKILGFALAVTVFIDATVVRMAIGPALLCLAGNWNWWPDVRTGSGAPISSRRLETTETALP